MTFEILELAVDHDEGRAEVEITERRASLMSALNTWQEMIEGYNEVEAVDGDAVWHDREVPMPGIEFYSKAFVAGMIGVTRLARNRRSVGFTIVRTS